MGQENSQQAAVYFSHRFSAICRALNIDAKHIYVFESRFACFEGSVESGNSGGRVELSDVAWRHLSMEVDEREPRVLLMSTPHLCRERG